MSLSHLARGAVALVGLASLVGQLGTVGPIGGPAAAQGTLPPAVPDVAVPPWVQLGPVAPRRMTALGAAPGWPEDPVLLALREDDLVRTRDGGRTREALPPVPGIIPVAGSPESVAVSVAPAGTAGTSPVGDRTIFVMGRAGLQRSADTGATWQHTLPLPAARAGSAAGTLSLSPDFGRDGLAFVVAYGRAYRSRDGGATWEERDATALTEPGQPPALVQQVAFSPAYAADRTLWLVATSGNFPGLTTDPASGGDATDHVDSPGVLMSQDAGETWTPAVAGMEVEGVPYRHVQGLFISPTFGQDGTVFADAWGPREAKPFSSGQARDLRSALFRSTDRGASWQPVALYGAAFTRRSVDVALSPSFARDGLALRADSSGGLSPASGGCTLHRSVDFGVTWTQVAQRGSYESCSSLLVAGAAPAGVNQGNATAERAERVVGIVRKGGGWLKTFDGGQTWSGLSEIEILNLAPVAATRRAVLVGAAAGGVWALGDGIVQTLGTLTAHGASSCTAEPVLGFGRVWQAESWVRSHLGCPVAPEATHAIRERREAVQLGRASSTVQRGYWVEERADALVAEWPLWFDLRELFGDRALVAAPVGSAVQSSRLSLHEKPRNWPEGLETARTLQGMAQRFEGGAMLFLVHEDGRRSILALSTHSQSWREYPD
ncbi:MAG: GH74 [uncultured Chloroflexi bacterium]|uniref:GH74 n=1 Tax=uncultured Chloroflexota bacterium TaxID=166587 RepID=A0A6J4KJC6_9CHLR|nr:MAG: GH74 [uncultured Chloroflexota bacterium]